MVSLPDSRSNGPGSSLARALHCVPGQDIIFTLTVPLFTQVHVMNTGKLTAGGGGVTQ